MLRWAAIFLVIALIAAVFGFTDIASASASIAQVLFSIFLILFLGAVILGIVAARILPPSCVTHTTVNEPRATSARSGLPSFRKRN